MTPVRTPTRPLLLALTALAVPGAFAQQAAPDANFRAEEPPPQVRALFDHCDTNHDAQLSWPEFIACWRQMRYARQRPLNPTPNDPAVPRHDPAGLPPASFPPAPDHKD